MDLKALIEIFEQGHKVGLALKDGTEVLGWFESVSPDLITLHTAHSPFADSILIEFDPSQIVPGSVSWWSPQRRQWVAV